MSRKISEELRSEAWGPTIVLQFWLSQSKKTTFDPKPITDKKDENGRTIAHHLIDATDSGKIGENLSTYFGKWADDHKIVVDLNIKDHQGLTPVHYAAKQGVWTKQNHIHVLPLYCFIAMKRGFDFNQPDKDGDTVLHYAAAAEAVTCSYWYGTDSPSKALERFKAHEEKFSGLSEDEKETASATIRQSYSASSKVILQCISGKCS